MVIIFCKWPHDTRIWKNVHPATPTPLAPGYWMIPFGLLTGKQTWFVFTLVHAFSLFYFLYFSIFTVLRFQKG